MSEELEKQLEQERSARTAAEQRAANAEQDLARMRVAHELARELRRHVADEAVDDISAILSDRVKIVDGRLCGIGDLAGKIGPTALVEGYLEGKGAFLKQTAGRDGRRQGGAADNGERDIGRAIADPDYMQDWKARDPAGFKRAWNAHLKAKYNARISA